MFRVCLCNVYIVIVVSKCVCHLHNKELLYFYFTFVRNSATSRIHWIQIAKACAHATPALSGLASGGLLALPEMDNCVTAVAFMLMLSLHSGMAEWHFMLFRSCDLNLEPRTFIYELYLTIVQMYLHTKKWTLYVNTFESYRITGRITTKNINTAASRAVKRKTATGSRHPDWRQTDTGRVSKGEGRDRDQVILCFIVSVCSSSWFCVCVCWISMGLVAWVN